MIHEIHSRIRAQPTPRNFITQFKCLLVWLAITCDRTSTSRCHHLIDCLFDVFINACSTDVLRLFMFRRGYWGGLLHRCSVITIIIIDFFLGFFGKLFIIIKEGVWLGAALPNHLTEHTQLELYIRRFGSSAFSVLSWSSMGHGTHVADEKGRRDNSSSWYVADCAHIQFRQFGLFRRTRPTASNHLANFTHQSYVQ